MKILAFESSAKAASVALLQEDALIGEAFLNCGLTHSRTLTQMAEELLANCGWSVSMLDAIACAAGPGSFTGIRIGVSAAKGLAWGASLPCCGVSTLLSMAYTVPMPQETVCAVMDARRSQFYNAVFATDGHTVRRDTPDRAIAVEALAEELAGRTGRKLLVGDGAALCFAQMKETVPDLYLPPEPYRHQRASGVGLAAWQQLKEGVACPVEDLVPNYLRLSQAERERLARLQEQERR